MAHDVFISHSSQDKPVADAACAALENAGVRCWIAPRDVQPGRAFAGEINRAIHRSKVLVLIFSAHSNKSEQVLREVQLASNAHLHIVQFRIQDVIPNEDLEYYLSAPHWLDALLPPLENHLDRLKNSVKALLQMDAVQPAASGTSSVAEKQPTSAVGMRTEGLPAPSARDITADRSSIRKLLPLAAAGALFAVIFIALGLFQLRNRPLTERRSQMSASPVATARSAFNSPTLPTEPAEPNPTLSLKGPALFTHNFDTASPIVRPLFGPGLMSVLNANGEGQITAKSPGVLPAMFDKFLLDDFIVECGMRADNVPPGARYGFIFRAADVSHGGIARYYALLLDPNQSVAALSCWMDNKWTMNTDQALPGGLLQNGQRNRVTLEAFGNRFRVFLDGRFAGEFHADGLTHGRIGICLLGSSNQPWTVHLDNFQIFLPPGKDHTSERGRGQSFQRVWDFSAGMLADIRTSRVELVDARIWKLPGGKHIRFLTGGVSWLEATFEIPADAKLPTRLTVRHLSSGADDNRPGFSPVRITLNGEEIFQGSPAHQGWNDEQINLGNTARPGTNVLRWEFLNGAQTHYWLKSFAVSGENE
jgi:hypothetical protein